MSERSKTRPFRFPLIVGCIVLFWLSMMGLLLYHEVIAPRWQSVGYSRQVDRVQDLWMGIYTGEDRIGFVNIRSLPKLRNGQSGMRMDFRCELELSLLKTRTGFSIQGESWIGEHGGLQDFDFSLKSGDHVMRVQGTMEGDLLQGSLESAGESLPFSFPVSQDLFLGGGMGLPSLDVPLLEPGQEIYVDAFDPIAMRMGKARLSAVGRESITVAGETVEAMHIKTTIAGIDTHAWVSEEEEVLRAETPFGFVLSKISPIEALRPVEASKQSDFIQRYLIFPTGITPQRGASSMDVKLSGIPESLYPQSDVLQTRTESGYSISMAALESIPADTPLDPEAREAALASDAFVAAEHPSIQGQAKSIIGETQDPWGQALKLYDWVYEEIDKTPVVSVPAALDVLKTREGDCNEHTVLFVALARAIGLPSRIAIGLVWSDGLGAFGYHAWPEVWRGAWIPMDPTLGQPIADASHLKLLNGGIDSWTQLFPYIGQIELEIVALDPAPAQEAASLQERSSSL